MVDLGATTPWRRTALFPEYRDRSLSKVFRELAVVCADRTAVRDGDRSLTYRELLGSIEEVAAEGGARPRGGGAGPSLRRSRRVRRRTVGRPRGRRPRHRRAGDRLRRDGRGRGAGAGRRGRASRTDGRDPPRGRRRARGGPRPG